MTFNSEQVHPQEMAKLESGCAQNDTSGYFTASHLKLFQLKLH